MVNVWSSTTLSPDIALAFAGFAVQSGVPLASVPHCRSSKPWIGAKKYALR